MEGMQVPFAVFQLVEDRIETLVVSDGLCELLGSKDRTGIYAEMDQDACGNVHPDDRERVRNALFRFLTDGAVFHEMK